MTDDTTTPRYVRPGWFTQHVFNPAVALLTRAGLSVWGSRELRVRGRASGEWRSTPVNLLTHGGARYLVAPRGNTQWVRNVRAAGGGCGGGAPGTPAVLLVAVLFVGVNTLVELGKSHLAPARPVGPCHEMSAFPNLPNGGRLT